MKTFQYTIKDSMGLHARPTGELVMIACQTAAEVMLESGDQIVDLKNPMALMRLAVRCGDSVKVTADGADEEEVIAKIKAFMEEFL